MTPGFVAAVLEGFEGTLDAVLEQLGDGDLQRDVQALQEHIAQQRRKIGEQEVLEPAPPVLD